MKTLSDKMKRINWELTNELHLDDGKQIGGCPIFLHFSDVKQFIKDLKDKTILITDHDEGMKMMEEIDALAGEKLI